MRALQVCASLILFVRALPGAGKLGAQYEFSDRPLQKARTSRVRVPGRENSNDGCAPQSLGDLKIDPDTVCGEREGKGQAPAMRTDNLGISGIQRRLGASLRLAARAWPVPAVRSLKRVKREDRWGMRLRRPRWHQPAGGTLHVGNGIGN